MKSWIRLLITALALTSMIRGEGVSVSGAPDWSPANETQAKALKSDPLYSVIDFSFYGKGGAGTVLRSPVKEEINKQFMEGSVKGYIDTVTKGGQTIENHHPASIGALRGVCLTSKGESGGRPFGVVSYLVYSKNDFYAISVYGQAGLVETDPLVLNYLSRIKIDSSVLPGDIDRDSGFEQGRKFGQRFSQAIFALGIIAGVVGCVVIFIRRKREMKPPPLTY